MVDQYKSDLLPFLPNWPNGPLDEYRKKANIDWRSFKLLFDDAESIKLKHHVWTILANDPLFGRNPWDETPRLELRKITFLRMKRLIEYNFLDEQAFISNPKLGNAVGQVIGQYDWALGSKKFLSYEYFIGNARSIGSSGQNQFMQDVLEFNALGCIAITELAHGSNTKALRTRATYDPNTREFVLLTPSLQDTKVWSGVLGQTATHAHVFAQLYTADGVCHGLHTFLVPVRDPKTLLPFENVQIGDMGPKLGLNGLDNGFMRFKNYRISKNCLLNRNVNINDSGEYLLKSTKVKPQEITLGILSLGRVTIILQCALNAQTALSIAVRYAAVRKQFGPPDQPNKEWPIIEYETHQWRLLPYVAASLVWQHFYNTFYLEYINFFISSSVAYGSGDNGDDNEQALLGAEIHCLSCAGKAVSAWIARDAIQECREACGGHGYLKASRFGELRDNNDPNCTYEGDNNVILQQTSNLLIKKLKEFKQTGLPIQSPLGSFDFLNNYDQILSQTASSIGINGFQFDQILTSSTEQVANLFTLSQLQQTFQWLVCHLLRLSMQKLNTLQNQQGLSEFQARARTNVYWLQSLAVAYIDCEVLRRFVLLTESASVPANRACIQQLASLFALWRLEPHVALLLEGGFLTAKDFPLSAIREQTLALCRQLQPNAVALVDSFAPPDFILNSVLGQSDGRVYERIFDALTKNDRAMERADWWEQFTKHKPNIRLTSKL